MNSTAIKEMIETTRSYFNVPVTPRGRAIHTVDWFMNGERTRSNYDDTRIKMQDVRGR